MKRFTLAATAIIAIMLASLGYNAARANWSGPAYETPLTPLPQLQSQTYPSFDVQTHSRDDVTGFESMAAEHGSGCQGPPATHVVDHDFSQSVFICNGHVMTAANAGGYGLIALTPNQLIDCTQSCSIQWDMSTERLSTRDWPDVWVTPWIDNLTLPFDAGDVDLQGVPRQGIHVDLNNSQSAWLVKTITNYSETTWNNQYGNTIQTGINAGVNQAAVRQPFKMTLSGGNHIRLERIASATAPALVYFDGPTDAFPTTDLVVQFAHHSYNPTKDGAGVPATWHWSDFNLENAAPFTLIHAAPLLASERIQENTLITFDAPAPANAYLRFTGLCQVLVDGVVQPKQTFIGHYEHAASYFVPIAQGKQSVTVSFASDNWFNNGFNPGCFAQDFAVWAKPGSGTPTPVPPTSTPAPPTPTSVPPTATKTPLPPTATATPTPTSTPVLPTRMCTKRWGNNTIVNYGTLTEAQCLAVGP